MFPRCRSIQISAKAMPKPSDNVIAQFGDAADVEARVAQAGRRQAQLSQLQVGGVTTRTVDMSHAIIYSHSTSWRFRAVASA